MGERRRFLVAIALTSLFGTSGCEALLFGGGVAAGAGTVAYFKGDLEFVENVELAQAYTLTQSVMRDMGFSIETASRDHIYGRVLARDTQNRQIRVTLWKKGRGVTEFNVRVGYFGDHAVSETIRERMRRKL